MKENKLLHIIENIVKHVNFSKKWECIEDSCGGVAINSHLLQQNGILNNVSENGELVEIKSSNIFEKRKNNIRFVFKKKSIRKSFSLKLYCQEHDSKLFESIENKDVDFYEYRTKLLFCLRVVSAEIRKKEINIEIYNRVLKSQSLKGFIDSLKFEMMIEGALKGIEDLVSYRNWINDDLNGSSKNFVFKHFEYPLIKVYGSAIFSPANSVIDDIRREEPLPSVFVNVIPYNERLNIFIGYFAENSSKWIEDYAESWNNLNPADLEIKLTNLFSAHIENWGMSPNIYSSIDSSTLRMHKEFMNLHGYHSAPNDLTNFNFFQNNNYG